MEHFTVTVTPQTFHWGNVWFDLENVCSDYNARFEFLVFPLHKPHTEQALSFLNTSVLGG